MEDDGVRAEVLGLFEEQGAPVYRFALALLRNHQDAEDVVQETFVRAYRQLARFEARANFATWLYRIGFNCSIDHLRNRNDRETRQPPETLDRLAPAASGPTSEDLVFAGEIGERVQHALNALSEQERAAFLMRHYHGCSIDEICHALGLRTNAAKHSIFRAVKKMRTELRPLVRMRMEGL